MFLSKKDKQIYGFEASYVLLALATAMFSVLFVNDGAFSNMLMLWLTTDTYMHGIFVLPLVALMIKQKSSPTKSPKPLSMSMFVFITLTWCVIYYISSLTLINSVIQIAGLSLIPCFVLVIFGWRWLWHYRLELSLLFLAVPLGDFLVPWLQDITAELAVFFLKLSGVDVIHHGWYITIEQANFRVAEACSGINFLISTFVVSIFYSVMFFKGLAKRFVFSLLGFVVPILTNGVRVYLIIMIAHWGNVEAATSFDHVIYGWIFFTAVLLILFYLAYLMSDNKQENYDKSKEKASIILHFKRKEVLKILLFVLSVLVTNLFIINKTEQVDTEQIKVGFEQYDDVLGIDFPEADKISINRIGNNIHYNIYYFNESSDKKLLSFDNRLFSQDKWSINKITTTVVDNKPTQLIELISINGVKKQLYLQYKIDNHWYSSKIKVKLAQLKGKLLGTDNGGEVHFWLKLK